MQSTADFLGVALYICANITKGPAGWLKMGVRLIEAASKMEGTSEVPSILSSKQQHTRYFSVS